MFNFLNYMRNVCESLKDIQHHPTENKRFHRISSEANMEEFLFDTSRVSHDGIHVLAIDNMEGRYTWNGMNFLDIQDYSFFVVKHVKALDSDDKEIAKRECKLVCQKIMSKFLSDQFNILEGSIEDNGLRYFDRTSMQYFTLGPIGDNFYGVQCSVLVTEYPASFKFNNSDWIK
jgi:hypothetical protein